LINRFGTGTPNVKAMAGVLVDDQGVPENAGERVAKLLVDMATEAELIVDDRWSVAAIEQAVERVGEIAVVPAAKPGKPKPAGEANPQRSQTRSRRFERKPETKKTEEHAGGGEADGRPFGVSVVLQVDATKLSAPEIKEIARELAGLGEVTTSR
jgi:hypothetical protein